LNEVYASDPFLANDTTYDGYTMAQLYCVHTLFDCCIWYERRAQMPGTLLDLIRKWGSMSRTHNPRGEFDDECTHGSKRKSEVQVAHVYDVCGVGPEFTGTPKSGYVYTY
jgi:hypothetical protein